MPDMSLLLSPYSHITFKQENVFTNEKLRSEQKIYST